MSSLRLITFDLDDTLWDVAPVMNNAEALLREWLASNAARLGPVPIEHLWAIRTRLLDREPMLRHRLSELRRRILFHALLDAGYPQAEAESLAASPGPGRKSRARRSAASPSCRPCSPACNDGPGPRSRVAPRHAKRWPLSARPRARWKTPPQRQPTSATRRKAATPSTHRSDPRSTR